METVRCRIVFGEPQNGLEPKKIGGFGWYTLQELRDCKELVPNMRLALDKLAKLVEKT